MKERGNPIIVFISLAMNQAEFFKAVGEYVEKADYSVVHVCFHEGSSKWLSAQGCRTFNPYEYHSQSPDKIDFARFNIERINVLLGHEKAAYEIADTASVERKLWNHLVAMEKILDELSVENRRVVVIQELGGFTSVLAAYFAARARGIDNIFIEPSFYRGRVFFTRNSLEAPIIDKQNNVTVSDEVRVYLENALKQRTAVIPVKDRHHYRGAWKKLVDPRNIRRFLEKLYSKYVLGDQEEFGHIGGHVWRHFRMQVNSIRLMPYYQEFQVNQPYIYYPLHVPADFALTIRSPEYLDQYALIDFLARATPSTHKIAIKEHPALVGAVEYRRIRALLRWHDNVILLNPGINNYAVLHAADAVVTVNSKSGAEAILLGKPVIVLGDAFYRPSKLVHRAEKISDIPQLLRNSINGNNPAQNEGERWRYFQGVWDASYQGELYDLDSENIMLFSSSLDNFIMTTVEK